MADDEQDASIDQLLRRCFRFLNAAGIVSADKPDGVGEHATALVEVFDRQLDGGPMARPRGGERSGERGDKADPDLLRGTSSIDGQIQHDGEQEAWGSAHGSHLLAAAKD
jgi:hypothetical protein